MCVCVPTHVHMHYIFLEIPRGNCWPLGEALKLSKWSIKSLWLLSTVHSSNSHHLSGAMRRLVWRPVKWCDLLFKVTIRQSNAEKRGLRTPWFSRRWCPHLQFDHRWSTNVHVSLPRLKDIKRVYLVLYQKCQSDISVFIQQTLWMLFRSLITVCSVRRETTVKSFKGKYLMEKWCSPTAN